MEKLFFISLEETTIIFLNVKNEEYSNALIFDEYKISEKSRHDVSDK